MLRSTVATNLQRGAKWAALSYSIILSFCNQVSHKCLAAASVQQVCSYIALTLVSVSRVFRYRPGTQMPFKKIRRLSFKDKYNLVKEVKSGASKNFILNKYGICERTYKRVLARESYLMKMGQNYEFAKKKSSKTSVDTALDAAVLKWFQEKRAKGDPINGPMLKERALILNKKLNGPQTFKASEGWLNRFKRRHGIRGFHLNEEKSSADSSNTLEFSTILKEKIESESLNLDNIYNANESGILWRELTACSLALHSELEASGCKDRVTALFCANVTGSHQIPLLTIGKFKTPECLSNLISRKSIDMRFKYLESLGLTYTHQKNAWMDKYIFILWYREEFIPRVLEYQRASGVTGKVVLLLENTSSHSSLDELNAININFEVMYLPPNVPASTQPMEQGLIATTKRLYKKRLLRRLLLSETSETAIKFLKEFNLRDCLSLLSQAWEDVQSSTLQKAWKRLLCDSFLLNALADIQDPLDVSTVVVKQESSTDLTSFSDNESENVLPKFPYEIYDQVSEMLSDNRHYNSAQKAGEFLLKWFENDHKENDCGWDSSSDCDFIDLADSIKCEPDPVNENENYQTILEESESMKIKSSEAFDGIMKFKNWLKLRSECSPKHLDYIKEFENILTEILKPKVTTSEALDGLLKFKSWLRSRSECLPKHLDYIKEFENLISESTTSQIPENKTYLRL